MSPEYPLDLRSIARALGGEVFGGQVLAPGPGHNRRDRSLAVKLSATSPDGFLTHSFSGDDWRSCRDYVKTSLGLDLVNDPRRPSEARRRPFQSRPKDDSRSENTAAALALWAAGVDPRGTLVERYLSWRQLLLDDDIAGDVLRWHPGVGAMLALFRDIRTDEPRAISRTFLSREGNKLGRKFLGSVKGAAIKLDADETVVIGVCVGEGIESCLSSRQLGLKPCWALGSAPALASFPLLNGVQSLSILREHDEANTKAAIACGTRWKKAGREVFDVWPNAGKDVNDAIREATP